MIPYRSLDDLSGLVFESLTKLPHDITMVLGVPRSGMIPATLIALLRHLPMLSLEAFLADSRPMSGRRTKWGESFDPSLRGRILVVDDSCNSGSQISRVKSLLAEKFPDLEFYYVAVFSTSTGIEFVDDYFELLEYPRLFEWNILNHPILRGAGVDLDGVLCADPTDMQNDDSHAYADFLQNATPLLLPRHHIGAIVTSRLEKYRPQTMTWLAKYGVSYDQLIMLEGYTAEQRRSLRVHGKFKAETVRRLGFQLFIESNDQQAREIVELSGVQVFSLQTRTMYYPKNRAAGAVGFSPFGSPFLRRFKQCLMKG